MAFLRMTGSLCPDWLWPPRLWGVRDWATHRYTNVSSCELKSEVRVHPGRFVILSCTYDLNGCHSCYDAKKVSPQTAIFLADRPSKYSQTLFFNSEHMSSSKGSQIAYAVLHNTNANQPVLVRPHINQGVDWFLRELYMCAWK